MIIKRRCILLLLVVCFIVGCTYSGGRLKRESSDFIEKLPTLPDSVLISESGQYTGGSDSRCDGYLISRLYGTNKSIENIVQFIESEVLFEDGWSLDKRIPQDQTSINLMHQDGYLLGINTVELRPELIADPFFPHKEVTPNQPYEIVYLLNVIHIDSSQVEYCWGQ